MKTTRVAGSQRARRHSIGHLATKTFPYAALCIVPHNDLGRVSHPVTRIGESPDQVNVLAGGEILVAATNRTDSRRAAYENSCWYVGHTASGPNWTWQVPHVERS